MRYKDRESLSRHRALGPDLMLHKLDTVGHTWRVPEGRAGSQSPWLYSKFKVSWGEWDLVSLKKKQKTKTAFYLRCISDDMFNPLNQNSFFITHLILQKNLTIVQCISYKLLISLSYGIEEIFFNSPSMTYDSLFKYLRLEILFCTWN